MGEPILCPPSAVVRGAATRDALRALGLPPEAVVVVIVRDREAIPPRWSTEIRPGDRVCVLVHGEARPGVEDVFTAV
jgi:Trk K+ transport system NAD-binding subunit